MKRPLYLITFIIITFFNLSAKICYNVIDESGQGVDGAVITACDTVSDRIIEVCVTDANGEGCFKSDLNPLDCIIVSAPGYIKFISAFKDCTKSITIIHDAMDLNEVNVYADKDQLRQKGGAFVFTPGSLKTEVANIYDLIKYVPLVNYEDGLFKIIGRRSNAKIKINGQEPREWGSGLFEALQSLPATMVKRVEVTPSSGSSESASFDGGIINIVIEMPDEGTLNRASASLRYTRDFSTNESYWIGLKHERFNASANFSFSNSANNNEIKYSYNFTDIDKFVNQNNKIKSNSQNINGNVNISYKTSSTSSLGMGIGLSSGHEWDSSFTSGTTEIGGDTHRTEFRRQSHMPWHTPSYGMSLWYTLSPDPDKNIIDIFVGYSHNARNSYNLYNNLRTADMNPSEERQDLTLKANSYAAQAKYLHLLTETNTLNAGYSLTGINVSQTQTYTDNTPDNFRYKELVNAIFAEWNAQWSPNFSTKIGIRGECLHVDGNQISNFTRFSKNYWSLYPSIAISGNIPKGDQSLLFTIDRRIYVPIYETMNPYIRWSSESSYYVGNPDLKPSFSWNFELTYSFLKNWIISMNYIHHPDGSMSYTYNKDGYTVSSISNVSTSEYTALNIQYYKSFWNRLRVNLSATLSHVEAGGIIEDDYLSYKSTSVLCNIRLNYLISKRYQWRASANFRYISPDKGLTDNGKHIYNLGIEVTKDWKNGLNIKLGCDRIIYNNSPLIFTSDNYDYYQKILHMPIHVSLSLAYAFGNLRVNPKERPMQIK